MIVAPDFLDHWRTVLLTQLLEGDDRSPLYILRLWAHCQNRRQEQFNGINANAVKAICRFDGDAATFCEALIEAGFIQLVDSQLTVVGWAEYNASLLANWENGAKGGRPKGSKNKPKPPEEKTQPKPMGNPPETQTEPMANPTQTHGEPIRVEKSRLDQRRVDQKQKQGADKSAVCVSRRPPTVDEVRLYCETMNLAKVDPSEFHDHYTAAGWKLKGGQPMKDWQATARNWQRRDFNDRPKTADRTKGAVYDGQPIATDF